MGDSHRLETDLLGEREVPIDAYYGIQTLRAQEAYTVTGVPVSHFPDLVDALVKVKLACCRANYRLGGLEKNIRDAIEVACLEILEGKTPEAKRMRSDFVLDMIQGGAGTSTNMCTNEIIANRALEILGRRRGDYEYCSPNDHVNLSQSTNDAYPTSCKLAVYQRSTALREAMDRLVESLEKKAIEFQDVVKVGRTELMDAVPMTLGLEFKAFASTLRSDQEYVASAARKLTTCNLGGTAVGTGISAHKNFPRTVIRELQEVTGGLPCTLAPDLVEASSSVGSMLHFSGVLRRVAVKLSKICNDIRLLASGPRCGFNEISLPAVAPGSSIMPGKVNPVIPEMVNSCAFQVCGNDLAVVFAAEAGQLELNAFEPVVVYNLLMSVDILSRAMDTLGKKCIDGITANTDVCASNLERSIGVVTALVPHIGYKNATDIAKEALESGRNVLELVSEMDILSRDAAEEAIRHACLPANMRRNHSGPGVMTPRD